MKPTAPTPKVCNNNEDSTDDEDDNTMEDIPGLQHRDRPDSSSDEDSSSDDYSDYNQGDDEIGPRESRSDEDCRLGDSDDKQNDQHQYFLTSTNIIPLAKLQEDDDDDGDEYDGDNDDEEDDMPRLATRYPTDTLLLCFG